MVEVKIKRLCDVNLPKYAKDGDAGLDLCASSDMTIKAGEKAIVKTGIAVSIPKGYVGLIWDRSGLAAKHSMTCLAGVIDSGYRGEIGVVMVNLGKEDFSVEKNMRIAQMLVQPVEQAKLTQVDELDESHRGESGFGSSGHK